MNDKITKQEIEKWLNKMEKKLENVKPKNDQGKEFFENINAYVYDCRHFMENEDYVRSFEAIIWAWAWFEIGEKFRILK